mgnify:FL=1
MSLVDFCDFVTANVIGLNWKKSNSLDRRQKAERKIFSQLERLPRLDYNLAVKCCSKNLFLTFSCFERKYALLILCCLATNFWSYGCLYGFPRP